MFVQLFCYHLVTVLNYIWQSVGLTVYIIDVESWVLIWLQMQLFLHQWMNHEKLWAVTSWAHFQFPWLLVYYLLLFGSCHIFWMTHKLSIWYSLFCEIPIHLCVCFCTSDVLQLLLIWIQEMLSC